MDALKKAETDKQEQAQAKQAPAPDTQQPVESLSLELSEQVDEFADLPETDVVDDPQIQTREIPQASLQLEPAEPGSNQLQEQPRAVALGKIKNTRNRQRYFIIAAMMTVIAMLVGGYYFWRLSSINQPATSATPANDLVNGPDNAVPAKSATPATPQADNTATPPALIKRAAPVSQESFFTPDPEPVVVEKPIKIKKHSANLKNTRALINAYKAYTNGDWQTARTLYGKVLQRLPRNRDAMLGLAAIALKEGQTGLARQHYRNILELNPMDPAARTALVDLNSTEEVSNDTSQIKYWLQTNQNDAQLQFVLGNRYAQTEQWSKAQQAYFQAHQNSPDNADYAFNLAISLEQLDKPELALRYYRIARQNAAHNKANFDTDILRQRLEFLASKLSGAGR